MGLLGDAIGLTFKVRADTDDGRKELDKFFDNVDKQSKTVADGENAFTRYGDSVSDSTDKIGKFSSALPVAGAVLAGTTAAVVGGATALFALAKQTADAGIEIERFQKLTGFSAQAIGALKVAADSAGTSLDEIEEVFESFVELMIEGGQGAEDAAKKIKSLGLDPQKAYKDLEGSFLKVLDKIREMPTQAGKAKIAMSGMGESGLNMIKVADRMEGGTAKYIATLKEQGLIMDAEGIKKSEEFTNNLNKLTGQITGLTREISIEFMPVFTDAMDSVSKYLAKNKDDWRTWGTNLADVMRGARSVVESETASMLKSAAKLWFLYSPDPLTSLARGAYQAGQMTGEYLKSRGKESRRESDAQTYNAQIYAEENAMPGVRQFVPPDKRIKEDSKPDIEDETKQTKGTKTKKSFELSSDGKALVEAARRLGVSPVDLATIISYETSGTFSPTIRGGKGGNYTGLIQFGKEEYKKYNVGKNNTFESQLLNSVVPFLQDRFKAVGRSTRGADILSLYKTVNGGNPNVSEKASDGNGTIFDHVERMVRKNQPKVISRFFGGKEENVKGGLSQFDKNAAELKSNEEKVKSRETADKRILELAKSAASEEKAVFDNLLEQKLISEKDYADQIAEIGLNLLRTEKTLLEQRLQMRELSDDQRADLEQQIKLISSDIRTKEIEKDTEAIKQQKSEIERQNEALERQREIAEEIAEMRRQVVADERALTDLRSSQERRGLEKAVDNSFGQDRVDALIVLREFDLKIAEESRQRAADDAKDEFDRAIRDLESRAEKDVELKKKTDEIKLELEKSYKNRLLMSDEEYEARKKEIEGSFNPSINTAQKQTSMAGVIADSLGGGIDPNNEIQTQAEYIKGVYADLKGVAGDAIGSMVGGLAQLGAQWAITGKMSGRAVLQMTTQILAGLAAQAAVKAVFELAEGYAALANPFTAWRAPIHFAAAKTYAIVGGVAMAAAVGVGALSRMGTENGQKDVSGSVTKTAQNNSVSESANTDKIRVIEENRLQANQLAEQDKNRTQAEMLKNALRDRKIFIEVAPNNAHIIRVVADNLRDKGDLEDLIINKVNES